MLNTTPVPSPVAIGIRPATWDTLRATTGLDSDAALAAVIGVAERTVNRVLAGAVEPSSQFIARTLVAFPFAAFDRLFTITRKPS